MLSVAFFAREGTAARPFVNPRMLPHGNILLLLLLALAGFFLTLMPATTSSEIPLYLHLARKLRELVVGQPLPWIPLPQLVLAPQFAALLRRIDGLAFLMAGTQLIGVTGLMASRLTTFWARPASFLANTIVGRFKHSSDLALEPMLEQRWSPTLDVLAQLK